MEATPSEPMMHISDGVGKLELDKLEQLELEKLEHGVTHGVALNSHWRRIGILEGFMLNSSALSCSSLAEMLVTLCRCNIPSIPEAMSLS